MNIRVGKDISLKWSILTDGVPVPLEGRALSLTMTYPDGKVQSLFFTTEEHHVMVSLLGRDLTETGVYSLTLWENKGKGGQTAVDYINAFRLVANTSMEDKSVANNLRVATKNLGYSRLEKTMGNGAGQEGGGKEAPIGSRSINGSIYLTATGNTIETVERVQGSQGEAYRCYFKALTSDGGVIPNLWRVGDQAYHKEYGTERTYWRKVVATNLTEGIDTGAYHFVDLSAADCAEGSVEPQEKDEIVQLGYRGNDAPERQVAIILSGEGAESPYIRQHTGIKSYSLPEAELQIRPGHNSMSARVSLLTGSKGLKNLEEWDEVEGNILQLQLDLIALQELLGIAQKDIESNSASIADALRDAKDALENANAAAIDAADAKLRFEEIADDEIISVAEKHVLRTELARIKADYSDIKNELEQYEVEKEEELWTAYEKAYNDFKADLEAKISTTGNVSVGNLLTLQDTYYDKRTLLLDGIYKAAKALADKANDAVAKVEQSVKDVQRDVDTANTVAGEAKAAAEQAQADAKNAQEAADSAQEAADKADEKFDAWAADDVISPVERKSVKDELAFIVADYNDIQNQIAKYGLQDTETDKSIDNFTTYYNWYKGNLEYVLDPKNAVDGVVEIPGAMNAHQDGYYAARTVILEKIAAAAKAVADNAVKIAEDAEKRAEALEEVQGNINAAIETLDDRMVGYEGNVAEINARLDGVVENYFLKGAPTLDGEPVSDWVTDLEKINHVGDTYTNINPFKDDKGDVIDEDAGKSWRWCFCTEDVTPSIEVTDKQGNKKRMHWHPIADSDAVKALLEASNAMKNADGRARTFVTKAQPTPPYDEGDLWLQGPDGDIMVCKEGIRRPKGDTTPADVLLKDWELACGYTDDSALNEFIDGSFSEVTKNYETLKGNVDAAGEKLKNVYTIAQADGKISESEAKAIAEAKAELQKAENELKEYTNSQIDGLATGAQNLLVNSGFTGSFEVVALNSGSTLKQMFEMFSESLEYWKAQNAEATTSEYTQTGKAAYLYGSMSSLSQSIIHDIYPDKDYVLSFSAKGSGVVVYFGGVEKNIPLTANWDRYVWKLKTAASFDAKILHFAPSGSMTIGDIKLEEGTIPSEWSISPYDNRSTMAKFEEGAYLQELLKVPNKISTDSGFIETGVLNAGIIQMGDYTAGVMTRVTAGMSGNYADKHSVAFFGGGSYAQAINTVTFYKENPKGTPSEGELAKMAKIVLTHGGRAILEDAIVRGNIYANNGYFKGKIEADSGYFKGTVAARTVLTEVKQLTIHDDGYVIGEGTGTYYTTFYCPQLAESAGVKTIYLPIAEQHKGMELSFFCDNRGEAQKATWHLQGSEYDSAGHLDVINASTSNAAISSYNTVILNATNTMYRFISMPDQKRENRHVWWAMQPVGGGTEYA